MFNYICLFNCLGNVFGDPPVLYPPIFPKIYPFKTFFMKIKYLKCGSNLKQLVSFSESDFFAKKSASHCRPISISEISKKL